MSFLPSLRTLPPALAGGVLVLAAACGAGAVEVPVSHPPASVVRLCHALHDRLPPKVHGQSRRATTPQSPLITAWGSPAIVLRCGVPRPAALKPTSDLVTVNDVNWLGFPVDRPVTFTAVGRLAYVEVTVPAAYQPAGDVLVELGRLIKAAVPATSDGSL